MKQVTVSQLGSEELQKIAQDILALAKARGADDAEVSITADKGFSITAQDNDVETIEYHQDKVIELNVYFGQRSGSASLSDLRPHALQAAVEAACHIAKFTSEDPAAGLASKAELAASVPSLQIAFPWAITVEEAIALACACEREALSQDKRIMRAEETSLSTHEGLHVYANTHDFMGCFTQTRHELSCVLVARDGDDMQRDYSYTLSADPKQLHSTQQVATEAVRRTVSRLGARRLPTMKAPVIFLAEEARSLLGHFSAAIQGGKLYRKASFLLDQLDQQIFPPGTHIAEQPHLACSLGSAPFDADGVVTRTNVFVEDGRLRSYALGVYAARKLGMQTTANAGGVHNLMINTSAYDLPALLKLMDRGLLVTELMGNGVNLLTGDYSRGASGYWVEGGEIQYPVHEITIAGHLSTLFKSIRAIGNDVDERGNIRTGSILIEEMMIAGE